MANPFISESKIQRDLEALNPNKRANPDRLFLKVLKTLKPPLRLCLSRMLNLSLQTSQIPDDLRCAIVTPVAKAPSKTDPNLFRHINLTPAVCQVLEATPKGEGAYPFVPVFLAGLATAWLPLPLTKLDRTPRSRRIGHKMARQRRRC